MKRSLNKYEIVKYQKSGFEGKQKILNKYEIVKYQGRFVGKQGGL